ncbi:MAG: class I SAM-dependent methyltransferase [Candidatus Omnitrophica bacterium]|nr:class I SAM-dependent methyltransferase [Candidatus Omnitrophota bacterium]
MENDICYRCGSSKHDEILRLTNLISITKCCECSLARTYPYPDFNFESQEKYSTFYLDNEKMFRMFASSIMNEIKSFKTGGNFLDIGCAVGYLLDEAKKAGFSRTEGIELNREAAAISRSKGHTLHENIIEKLDLGKETFDVISFNHVLEHILEYKPFLSAVSKALKKDGVIYCGVPNYDSFMQKLLRRSWYGWGMPDHVWHFDLSTFREVMEEAGFKAKKIAQNAMYYPYSKSLRKNTRATLARIAGCLGAGDQLYGIFTKY